MNRARRQSLTCLGVIKLISRCSSGNNLSSRSALPNKMMPCVTSLQILTSRHGSPTQSAHLQGDVWTHQIFVNVLSRVIYVSCNCRPPRASNFDPLASPASPGNWMLHLGCNTPLSPAKAAFEMHSRNQQPHPQGIHDLLRAAPCLPNVFLPCCSTGRSLNAVIKVLC